MREICRRILAGSTAAIALTLLPAVQVSAQTVSGETDTLTGISGQLLDEVVVTAKVPAVRVTPDRVVYDLKASVTGQSGSLMDALSSIPGVNISTGGSVTLYGNRGVAIMVDGQKIYLKGQDLANYMRSLPASSVSTIGLRTTVSAGDDASDKAGIIEITTRRTRDRGFTLGANLGASMWRNARCNGSVDMACNTARSELTLLCSSFAARQRVRLDIDRFFITDTDRMLQESTRCRTDNGNTVRAGWRYKLTSRTDLAANLSYSHNLRDELGRMVTSLPGHASSERSDNRRHTRRHNVMADLYLGHRFSSGATIGVSLNHFRYDNAERQTLEPTSADTLQSDISGHIRWFIDRIDFTRPFGRHWKLQAGLKNTFTAIRNAGTYHDREAGTWIPNSGLSSTFAYKANTNAAYAQISGIHRSIAATAGVRFESEKVSGNFTGNEIAPDTAYSTVNIDIVPVMELKYFSGGGTAFMLAYSQRIERPNYADLNPSVYVFDEYTRTGGNVNLHTSTADNFQFGFSSGSRWQGAVFLTHSDDAIMKCYREASDGSICVAAENLPHYLQYGLRLILANQPIGSHCHTTVTAIGLHNRYDWMDGKSRTTNSGFTPIVSVDNQFDFGCGWAGELKASYTGRMAYGQMTVRPSGYADIALRRNFNGGKASLTLFVKDIFATAVTRSELSHGGRTASYRETEYKRMAGLTFNYKFHTGRRTSGRHTPTKAPEELERL